MDRKAELEKKKAKLAAMREEKRRKEEEKKQSKVKQILASVPLLSGLDCL